MAYNDGTGIGSGLLIGVLLVAVVVLGLLFYNGGFNFDGGKDVNVKIEAPKVPAPSTGDK